MSTIARLDQFAAAMRDRGPKIEVSLGEMCLILEFAKIGANGQFVGEPEYGDAAKQRVGAAIGNIAGTDGDTATFRQMALAAIGLISQVGRRVEDAIDASKGGASC